MAGLSILTPYARGLGFGPWRLGRRGVARARRVRGISAGGFPVGARGRGRSVRAVPLECGELAAVGDDETPLGLPAVDL